LSRGNRKNRENLYRKQKTAPKLIGAVFGEEIYFMKLLSEIINVPALEVVNERTPSVTVPFI
jgi:hypothetical protein